MTWDAVHSRQQDQRPIVRAALEVAMGLGGGGQRIAMPDSTRIVPPRSASKVRWAISVSVARSAV